MPTTNKALKNWTDSDFIAWAKGELKVTQPLNDQNVAESVFKQFGLKAGTVDEAKTAVLSKQPTQPIPAEQPPEKPVNEQQPPVKETPPVDTEPKNSEPPPSQTPSQKKQPATPKQSLSHSNPTAKIILENLDQYIKAMKPGVAHHGNDGPSQQVRLFRTIQSVLRQTGPDFNALFGELLRLINEHRQDVFHERYLFRYFDTLSLTNRERKNFERILSLLIDTCDPKFRSKAFQRVDINAVMEGFNDTEVHQRVMSFYTAL